MAGFSAKSVLGGFRAILLGRRVGATYQSLNSKEFTDRRYEEACIGGIRRWN